MDRITRLIVRNVRAIESLDLDLGALTVLIGENGACKSTIIEVFELLRKAAEPTFFERFYDIHRGMPGLLRKGATQLTLGLVIEDASGDRPALRYEFSLRKQSAGAVVAFEKLTSKAFGESNELEVINRTAAALGVYEDESQRIYEYESKEMDPEKLMISNFRSYPMNYLIQTNKTALDAADRVAKVLKGIEVQLPFDTLAAWGARSLQSPATLRGSTALRPADRLSLRGTNLANAWAELRNQKSSQWENTLALVRLGLGEAIDTIMVEVDAGGGNVAPAVRRLDLDAPIPAADLSDGQLSWLAFVAMVRLNAQRSLLAIDEPELHLHPALLGRVVELLKEVKDASPVVISTHADRVLELLDDPADSIRVCSLEAGGKAVVATLDAEALPRWLEKFGDLGRLRESGYLYRVLAEPRSAEDS